MTAVNDQYGRCTNSTVPVLAVVPTVLVCSTARTNSTFVERPYVFYKGKTVRLSTRIEDPM